MSPTDPAAPPFLLIPSFDSSVLEYRRLHPLLAAQRATFAVDTVGCVAATTLPRGELFWMAERGNVDSLRWTQSNHSV